jgi:drug/metabolite transporter (DMT)-like permease
MKETYGYSLIVAASVIWGTMGIFGKLAFEYGIDPVTLIALRILISSTAILIPLALFKRALLRIQSKDASTIGVRSPCRHPSENSLFLCN